MNPDGAPLTICTLSRYSGGCRWSAGDTICFGSATGGLHQVAAGGGTQQQVTTQDVHHGLLVCRNPRGEFLEPVLDEDHPSETA